jgi:hypothetical protein
MWDLSVFLYDLIDLCAKYFEAFAKTEEVLPYRSTGLDLASLVVKNG